MFSFLWWWFNLSKNVAYINSKIILILPNSLPSSKKKVTKCSHFCTLLTTKTQRIMWCVCARAHADLTYSSCLLLCAIHKVIWFPQKELFWSLMNFLHRTQNILLTLMGHWYEKTRLSLRQCVVPVFWIMSDKWLLHDKVNSNCLGRNWSSRK